MSESVGPPVSKRRRRRWPWVALGLLLFAVVAAAIAVPLLLDVERYRGRIERVLAEATGWDTELGAIDFSLMRGMALTVSPVALAAPDGTSRIDVATVAVHAELWPLLRGDLIVRSIGLDGANVRLVRETEAAGWIVPGGAQTETSPEESGEGSRFRVSIERVMVADGRITLADRAADPPLELAVEDVELRYMTATGALTGSGRLDEEGGRISWAGHPDTGVALELDEVRTESLHPFLGPDLLRAGGRLSGKIDVAFPLAIVGDLTGKNVTLVAGERPLERFATRFRVATAGELWTLAELELLADGLTLRGSGKLAPDVDLTLYLPVTPLKTVLDAAPGVLPLPLDLTPPGSLRAGIRMREPDGDEAYYTAEGELSAASFQPSPTLPPARDFRATFDLDRHGVLRVQVLEGIVAGGPLRGTATLSSIDPPGTLSFDGGLEEAVLGQLLEGMVSESAGHIRGATGLTAGLTLDLSRPEVDARAVGGKLDLDSKQVGLPGWNLEGAIRASIEEKLGADLAGLLEREISPGREAGDSAVDVVEQVLGGLAASVDFDTWPWTLRSLSLDTDDLDANGSGTFDAETAAVALKLVARVSPEKTAELVQRTRELRLLVDPQGRLTLPLTIDGSLLSPSIGVDLGHALAAGLGSESAKDALEQEAKGRLRDLLKKELEKRD